jgi:hypothetical protein
MSGSATRDEVLGGTARRTFEWFDEPLVVDASLTARHATWLNPIERWFSILGRQLLARGSFTLQPSRLPEDVAAEIDASVAWYLPE